MAARWMTASRTRARGRDRSRRSKEARCESASQKASGEDYRSSGLPDLTITGLDTGEILGAFHGYADQTIISIIEDSSPTENKSPLDEESEATLLTALTEILDTVDDENPSPFDTLPDTELFASPKNMHDGLLGVGRHMWASFPDSGKDLLECLDPTVPQSVSQSPPKPAKGSFVEGNLPGYIGDTVSGVGEVSEPAADILDLQLDEQLDSVGLEDSVTLVFGQNLPCVINVEHVSLSDLVKYVHPYCLPSVADTDSADNTIELDIEIVEEGELLDLEGPAILCEGQDYPSAALCEADGLTDGEKPTVVAPKSLPVLDTVVTAERLPVLGSVIASKSLPVLGSVVALKSLPVLGSVVASKSLPVPGTTAASMSLSVPGTVVSSETLPREPSGQEVLLVTSVQEESPPAPVRKRRWPRKLRETAAARVQGCTALLTRSSLQAQLRATSAGQAPIHQRQDGVIVSVPEPRHVTQHTEGVRPATRRRLSRGRAGARGRGRQEGNLSTRAAGPGNQAPTETWPGPGGCRSVHSAGATGVEAVELRPGPDHLQEVSGTQEEETAVSPPAAPPPTLPALPVAPVTPPPEARPPFAPSPTLPAAPSPTLPAAPSPTLPAAPSPTLPAAPSPTLPAAPPGCDVQPSSEPRLRPISLEQYRQRLQQKQCQVGSPAATDTRLVTGSPHASAWPIVPIHSIVQGELSVLPLERLGSVLGRKAVLAQPSATAVLAPTTRGQAQTRTRPPVPALPCPNAPTPTLCARSLSPALALSPGSAQAQPSVSNSTQAPAAPSLEPAPVLAQLMPVHPPDPIHTLSPPYPAPPPRVSPTPYPTLSAEASVEGSRNTHSNLPQEEPVPAPSEPVLGKGPALGCPQSAEAQQQCSRMASAEEELGQTPASCIVQEIPTKDGAEGIEAADLMSLLEQFEVTEAKEEPSLGGNTGVEFLDGKMRLDQVLGAELASTAGLTPPATPPHQCWQSLSPACAAGSCQRLGEAEPSVSPQRTVRGTEAKPLVQIKHTKMCVGAVSPQSVPRTLPTPVPGFGDHEYCLPSVLSGAPLPQRMIPLPTAQLDVGCRWNVKHQPSITIKPIAFNHRFAKSSCQVLAADVQSQGTGSSLDWQESTREVVPPSSLQAAAAREDSRICSGAPEGGHLGCGSSVPEGGACVAPLPCGSGEQGVKKASDSPPDCARTLTSPCSSRQYSSSSGSSSRSRSRSPAQKRRRYYRRRSRHSRHSSRSDSRSSSRSRSCSRSKSRSTSGSRSRSRSSERCSVRMSYFTDQFDAYDVGPRHRYRCSRREAHEHKISRRRELAIEERRVVYVGKIRNGMMREELWRRFEVFGEIEDCNIYFRTQGDNYGFVTYRYTCDAFAAIENGQTLRRVDEMPFDLCFGGRRQFCKSNYADLDSSHSDITSYSSKNKFDSLDFDTLLKQAKRSLRR